MGCSADSQPAEIHSIKKFTSWNGFENSIRKSINKQTLSKCSKGEQLDNYDETIKLYINLPYMVDAREQLVRSCNKELMKNIRMEIQVKFVVVYNTTKLVFFYKCGNLITKLSSSFILYHFRGMAFYQNYIGRQREYFEKRLKNMATMTRAT